MFTRTLANSGINLWICQIKRKETWKKIHCCLRHADFTVRKLSFMYFCTWLLKLARLEIVCKKITFCDRAVVAQSGQWQSFTLKSASAMLSTQWMTGSQQSRKIRGWYLVEKSSNNIKINQILCSIFAEINTGKKDWFVAFANRYRIDHNLKKSIFAQP